MKEKLPNGWVETHIGEICLPVSKSGPSDSSLQFQYIDLSSIDNKRKVIVDTKVVPTESAPSRAKQVVRSGDTLFSTVRVYLENIAMVPHELEGEIASTAFCVLRPGSGINPRFLYYLTTSKPFIMIVNKLQRGNSPPSVQEGDVKSQRIWLPPSAEQLRIVSRIDELFSEIDDGERALERVQKLLERYRQSVLKAAVTGELTRDWRETNKNSLESGEDLLQRILKARREAWEHAELEKMRAKGREPVDDRWKEKYKEPTPPDTSGLPELPDGWVWASFPQLGDFGRGKSKHRPRNDPKLYGGPYPFLQTGTVRASRGRITEFDSTYNEAGLAQSRLWPKGTICITIAANIAESGILEFDACFPDSIVGLVPNPLLVPEYIEFFIRTARESLDRYAPATAQKNINLGILEKVAVPLPPREEQEMIYSKTQEELSKIEYINSQVEFVKQQSKGLRQTILRAAFSGEIVPQDPTDEATSLLEIHSGTR